MMNGTHNSQSAVAGTVVTIGSGAISFFGSSLVVVQWVAAFVAIVVGVTTFVHLVKNWNNPK